MKQGWQIKKLGCLCSFERGLTYSKGDEVSISTKGVLRSNNVDLSSNTLNFDEIKYLKDDIDIPVSKKVKRNSILMCMSNGSKAHLGKVAIIEDDLDYAFGGFMGLLVPDEDAVFPRYFYYALITPIYKSFIKSLSDGANINNLKFADLKEFEIPVPPLSEQQRIVALLDAEFAKIDALKANAEKNLQNAKDLFQAALKKELEPKEGWNKKRFGDVCKYQKEQGHYPHLKYVGLENIETGSGKLLGLQNGADILSTSFKFKNGYVMYGRLRPYLKKVFVADFEGCCSTEIFPIETKELLPHLLMYWFLSDTITDKINATCSGCRMPRANMNDVLGFDISIPTLSEQQQIVARLDALNEKCKTLQSNYEMTLSLCEDLKQALLRKAFNGEI